MKKYVISLVKGLGDGGSFFETIASSSSRKTAMKELSKWLDCNKDKYCVKPYQRIIKYDGHELIDFGDYTYFARVDVINSLFKNKKEERKWEENNMLTVGKLIEHLKKFDKNALVCYFETNSDSPWQPQSPDNLDWLVKTAKKDRADMLKDRKRNGMDAKKLKEWYKYTQPNDVLIRF